MREVGACKCSADRKDASGVADSAEVKPSTDNAKGEGGHTFPTLPPMPVVVFVVLMLLAFAALSVVVYQHRKEVASMEAAAKVAGDCLQKTASEVLSKMDWQVDRDPAVSAADHVYAIICVNYWKDGKAREPEDSLWWIGTLVMDFVGKRQDEDFGKSLELLNKTLVSGGCPDGPAMCISLAIMSGWVSPLYSGKNAYKQEDVREYNAYFSQLFKRLTSNYGKAKRKE